MGPSLGDTGGDSGDAQSAAVDGDIMVIIRDVGGEPGER